MSEEVGLEPGISDVSSLVHKEVAPPRVGMEEVEEPGGVGLLLVCIFSVGHGLDLVGVDEGSLDGALNAERVVSEDADKGGEDETGRASDGGHR